MYMCFDHTQTHTKRERDTQRETHTDRQQERKSVCVRVRTHRHDNLSKLASFQLNSSAAGMTCGEQFEPQHTRWAVACPEDLTLQRSDLHGYRTAGTNGCT